MAANPIVIAVDAMGGEHAPKSVIKGIELSAERHPDVRFVLFGDERKITPFLRDAKTALAAISDIVHTEMAISGSEKISTAIRNRKSSMWLAVESIKTGRAQAAVSSGNTGALMAISKLCLRTLPGIHRPALIALLPALHGKHYGVLDLGANMEANAGNLVQFAVMGKIFMGAVSGITEPKVGLLNIGTEEIKGREEIREAARILKERQLGIDFQGFAEGSDLGKNKFDLIVADGFSGNVALKTAEGTAKLLLQTLKMEIKSSFWAKIGVLFMHSALNGFKQKFDPRTYNGSMMIGLDGITVKSHGNSDHIGFANALDKAISLATHDVSRKIKEEIEKYALLSELI